MLYQRLEHSRCSINEGSQYCYYYQIEFWKLWGLRTQKNYPAPTDLHSAVPSSR